MGRGGGLRPDMALRDPLVWWVPGWLSIFGSSWPEG